PEVCRIRALLEDEGCLQMSIRFHHLRAEPWTAGSSESQLLIECVLGAQGRGQPTYFLAVSGIWEIHRYPVSGEHIYLYGCHSAEFVHAGLHRADARRCQRPVFSLPCDAP